MTDLFKSHAVIFAIKLRFMAVNLRSERPIDFISVKDAALVSAYTPTYLARLARSGRLQAMQRENKWFIDPLSLDRYMKSAHRTRTRKKKTLTGISAAPILKRAEYSTALTFHHAASGPFNLKSMLESLAIAGCSVIVGTLFYGAAEADLSLQALEQGAGHTFSKVYVQTTNSAEAVFNAAAAVVSQAVR